MIGQEEVYVEAQNAQRYIKSWESSVDPKDLLAIAILFAFQSKSRMLFEQKIF